ncbi:hypothetical protein BLNAU_20172 [Blattamonas nauphoetae]|uniref:Uncharacterized protein n=1 Tax=Blattamonas nauphoetae TaxID=2049346 RepID=A0ABQ9WZI2_9EUKA|nr:hypothetical protein BLNAU_20172 [Blattamonas nauphoetae]
MFAAPSSNDILSSGPSGAPFNELQTFFLQTVQANRSGTEKEKVWLLHAVLNKIEEGLKMNELSLFHVVDIDYSLIRHADPTLSVPATHAVGLVCDSSLSCGDVEGVLSGGVVEKVCSWVESSKEVGKVLGLLRVVEKLCVGLKGALRSAQKQEQEQKEKEKQKEKSGTEQGRAGQKKDESCDGWSMGSRCQSALDLMENTLLGLCSAWESEGKESSAEVNVEVAREVGGILAVHFPHVLSGGRKEVGVIGVDVGGEMRAMEERERRREEEMRSKLEEMTALEEVMKREADERRKEHELKMAELIDQAERHKRFIEEEKKRREKRKRRKGRKT